MKKKIIAIAILIVFIATQITTNTAWANSQRDRIEVAAGSASNNLKQKYDPTNENKMKLLVKMLEKFNSQNFQGSKWNYSLKSELGLHLIQSELTYAGKKVFERTYTYVKSQDTYPGHNGQILDRVFTFNKNETHSLQASDPTSDPIKNDTDIKAKYTQVAGILTEGIESGNLPTIKQGYKTLAVFEKRKNENASAPNYIFLIANDSGEKFLIEREDYKPDTKAPPFDLVATGQVTWPLKETSTNTETSPNTGRAWYVKAFAYAGFGIAFVAVVVPLFTIGAVIGGIGLFIVGGIQSTFGAKSEVKKGDEQQDLLDWGLYIGSSTFTFFKELLIDEKYIDKHIITNKKTHVQFTLQGYSEQDLENGITMKSVTYGSLNYSSIQINAAFANSIEEKLCSLDKFKNEKIKSFTVRFAPDSNKYLQSTQNSQETNDAIMDLHITVVAEGKQPINVILSYKPAKNIFIYDN